MDKTEFFEKLLRAALDNNDHNYRIDYVPVFIAFIIVSGIVCMFHYVMNPPRYYYLPLPHHRNNLAPNYPSDTLLALGYR